MSKINFLKITKLLIIFLALIFWPLSFLLKSGPIDINFHDLKSNTIFYYNPDSLQNILTEGYLYPTVWMSRLFQNKPSIYLHRFEDNFFALLDINNYFFAFHPREIHVNNQNLQKFPSLSLVFLLIGFYSLPKKRLKFFVSILIFLIFPLSLLKNFDRFDIILYPIISYFICSGIVEFFKKPSLLKNLFTIFFLLFSLIELTHTLTLILK